MSENPTFQGLYPSFYMDFPYFYPTQFEGFADGLPAQMENLPVCSYYQFWDQAQDNYNRSDVSFDKADENKVA